MIYRNSRDIYRKLYDIDQFDKYNNNYYLIFDKRIAEKNYKQYNNGVKLCLDIYEKERLLDIRKVSGYDFQIPINIIWGHFYNKFNDLVYQYVKNNGKLIKHIFSTTTYDSIIYLNDVACCSKSFEYILKLYKFLNEHPELYLGVNPNNIKYNYIYADKTIYFDDTETLDANAEGRTLVLNNLT